MTEDMKDGERMKGNSKEKTKKGFACRWTGKSCLGRGNIIFFKSAEYL